MEKIETLRSFVLGGLCIVAFSLGTSFAQKPIENPSERLQFELGSRFSLHHQVTDYAEYLSAENVAQRVEYGQTYEGRPLNALVFTHPDHVEDLETIRVQHIDRMNGGTGLAAYDDLAIVWLSYNVHGNEAVCTEAALEVMHQLATWCEAGEEIMRKLVVLVDPCLNPDGHDRYAVWFNQYASSPANPDPSAYEHDEPWPGGRPNHYLFDLNRDWAWQKQQESQQRSELYHMWMPHVHCDYHEMGYNSPYYFAPAAEPFHEAITPWQREFQYAIGDAASQRFDARGEFYFTRESFDLLYPSYGDTYPIYNGAIGMTYEQGGSGGAGILVGKRNGTLLSLRDRIDNHVETSISAVEVSAELSQQLVAEFAAYHEANRTQPTGRFGGYLIPVNSENSTRVDALVEFLGRHRIECERATSSSKPTSAYEYGPNSSRTVTVKPGDLLISSYQTHSRILDVLFDPDPVLTDSLTYDITTWSVPYAYGLQTFGLQKPVSGSEWDTNRPIPQWLPSSYGYAIAPSQDGYAKALATLHLGSVRIRTNSETIVQANSTYPTGSLFILSGDQTQENWEQILRALHTEGRILVAPVEGGHSIEGPDMGSDKVWMVNAPRVAMLTGEGLSSLGSGEVWWHFEQELAYPITRLDGTSSNPRQWDAYDAVVLPSGWYGFTDENWLSDLRAWVQAGGRVIAIERALNVFSNESGWGLNRYDNPDQAQSVSNRSQEERKANQHESFDDQERLYAMQIGSGSVYGVDLDVSHPLAWGYPDSPYYTLRSNGNRYAALDNGWTVGRYGNDPEAVSGFVGSRANRELAGSMAFGTTGVGRGSIVYFADNPLFRGFWENGKRLFDNAVFLPLN